MAPGVPAAPAGHGHSHGPREPASGRVRVLLALALMPFALATLIGMTLTWPNGKSPSQADVGFGQRPVQGEVIATRASPCSVDGKIATGQEPKCVALTIFLQDGAAPGTTIEQVLPDEPSTPSFTTGDRIVLAFTGGDPADPSSYQVRDFQRGIPMLWLAVLFAVAVLLLGRWKGIASLAALGFSFGVLLVYVLPAILTGHDPWWSACWAPE